MPAPAHATARPILQARGLTKRFRLSDGHELTACNEVSIDFYPGQTTCIVGESGCGKSTLLRMLMQLETPTSGEIVLDGRTVTNTRGKKLHELRRHMQLVSQDPSGTFNPRAKLGASITAPLVNYGLVKRGQRREKAVELLEMVGLPAEFANRYPNELSGGQCQRASIARALALEPDIIMCDEATSALDVTVQHEIVELLKHIQKQRNVAIGFVCHDLALAANIAHRIVVMYFGHVVETLPGGKLNSNARHPYTQMLRASVFDVHDRSASLNALKTITGQVPDPADAPAGCPFSTRCPCCEQRCHEELPSLREVAHGHAMACFRG